MDNYTAESYSVIGHLYGELNAHHILVANTNNRKKALELARSAHRHLNGHYGMAVYAWRDSSIYWTSEYIPSHLGEEAPWDSPHLKSLLWLGAYLRDRACTCPEDLPEDMVAMVKQTESWALFEELSRSRQFALHPSTPKHQVEHHFRQRKALSAAIVANRGRSGIPSDTAPEKPDAQDAGAKT